jgi:hypothetical protein
MQPHTPSWSTSIPRGSECSGRFLPPGGSSDGAPPITPVTPGVRGAGAGAWGGGGGSGSASRSFLGATLSRRGRSRPEELDPLAAPIAIPPPPLTAVPVGGGRGPQRHESSSSSGITGGRVEGSGGARLGGSGGDGRRRRGCRLVTPPGTPGHHHGAAEEASGGGSQKICFRWSPTARPTSRPRRRWLDTTPEACISHNSQQSKPSHK